MNQHLMFLSPIKNMLIGHSQFVRIEKATGNKNNKDQVLNSLHKAGKGGQWNAGEAHI